MADIKESLKLALANTFAFYLKAHFFHWNVTGADFPQYHDLFGKVYEQAFDEVDTIAELIRTLDEVAPGSLSRFKQLATISDADSVPDARNMVSTLVTDNKVLLTSLYMVYKNAEDLGEIGVLDSISTIIAAHHKLDWMLKSTAR